MKKLFLTYLFCVLLAKIFYGQSVSSLIHPFNETYKNFSDHFEETDIYSKVGQFSNDIERYKDVIKKHKIKSIKMCYYDVNLSSSPIALIYYFFDQNGLLTSVIDSSHEERIECVDYSYKNNKLVFINSNIKNQPKFAYSWLFSYNTKGQIDELYICHGSDSIFSGKYFYNSSGKITLCKTISGDRSINKNDLKKNINYEYSYKDTIIEFKINGKLEKKYFFDRQKRIIQTLDSTQHYIESFFYVDDFVITNVKYSKRSDMNMMSMFNFHNGARKSFSKYRDANSEQWFYEYNTKQLISKIYQFITKGNICRSMNIYQFEYSTW